jgi:hypothetical protein
MGFQTDRISLTTAVYDDTNQSALALKDVGANIPTIEQIGSLNIWLPNFDSVGDKLVFCHQFTHGIQEAASVIVYPHLHVITSTDSANVVRFQLDYQWVNNTDDLSTDATDTLDITPDALNLQVVSFDPVTKSNAHISSLFMGTLTRITNGASDYTGEVYLAFFDIHYKIDTLGSDSEASKTFPS